MKGLRRMHGRRTPCHAQADPDPADARAARGVEPAGTGAHRSAPPARAVEAHQAVRAPQAEGSHPPGRGQGPPGVFDSLIAQAIVRAIDLYFLDECGFAPTLPTTYTWARIGTRVIVPYVAPQGRRVNVLGALAPYGPQPRLTYHSRSGTIASAAFLEFLWRDVAGL